MPEESIAHDFFFAVTDLRCDTSDTLAGGCKKTHETFKSFCRVDRDSKSILYERRYTLLLSMLLSLPLCLCVCVCLFVCGVSACITHTHTHIHTHTQTHTHTYEPDLSCEIRAIPRNRANRRDTIASRALNMSQLSIGILSVQPRNNF